MTAWPLVPLGDVLEERKERIGSLDAEDLPLLGVSNNEGLHRSAMRRIPDMRRYLRVRRNWFAYNPMRVNVGSIGWAHSDDLVGVISPDYVVFSCSSQIDPYLLYWFLRTESGLRAINLQTAGSVRERLYFGSLAKVRIPLPPIQEQHRIVRRMVDLTARLETIRLLQADVTHEVAVLARSMLSRIFEKAQEECGTAKLSSLIVDAGYGTSVKCSPERIPSSVPVIRIPNVASGAINLNAVKFGVLSCREREKVSLEVGDVLLVRTNGSLDLVGRSAVVEHVPEPTAFASYLIRLRSDPRRILPHFLQSALNYLRQARWLGEFARTTAGQYNVSLGRLQEAEIPIPPIRGQRMILERLRAVKTQLEPCQSLRSHIDEEVKAVTASILNGAFNGCRVETD